MLAPGEPARVRAPLDRVDRGAHRADLRAAVREIQAGLNPHPSGQRELDVPTLDDEPVSGMRHKYRETILFFPSQGQTCHAYCTYCVRWALFVGVADLRFAGREAASLVAYLKRHGRSRACC